MARVARSAFDIRVNPAKAGFLDRVILGRFVDAQAKSIFQAAGETIRSFAGLMMPKAKRVRMSAAKLREQQYPPEVKLYQANPAPNMPAIRIKKGTRSPTNLSKPWYSVDNVAKPRAVFVGPPKLKSTNGKTVPAALERGGRIRKGSRMRRRLVGHGGEIRMDGRPSRTNRVIESDFGPSRPVTYIRIRTPQQARRANLIQRDLFKPPTVVSHPPRRYMQKIARAAMSSPMYAEKINRLMASWRRNNKVRFNLQRTN